MRELRKARSLDLADLSSRLTALGQPISLSALSNIELGQRRVDVDDLVALALALGVAPNRLLLPASATTTTIPLTPTVEADESSAWRWACGEHSLPRDDGYTVDSTFAEANRPHDPPDRTRLSEIRKLDESGAVFMLREGYRTAIDAGMTPKSVRNYLDLMDTMAYAAAVAEHVREAGGKLHES